MDVKIIDVLRLAYTFQCLDCDNHGSCNSRRRNALEQVIHRLQEMAIQNAPDSHELEGMLHELQQQQYCSSSRVSQTLH